MVVNCLGQAPHFVTAGYIRQVHVQVAAGHFADHSAVIRRRGRVSDLATSTGNQQQQDGSGHGHGHGLLVEFVQVGSAVPLPGRTTTIVQSLGSTLVYATYAGPGESREDSRRERPLLPASISRPKLGEFRIRVVSGQVHDVALHDITGVGMRNENAGPRQQKTVTLGACFHRADQMAEPFQGYICSQHSQQLARAFLTRRNLPLVSPER